MDGGVEEAFAAALGALAMWKIVKMNLKKEQ